MSALDDPTTKVKVAAQAEQVVVEEQELQLVIGQLVVVLAAQEVTVTLVLVLVELIKENPEAHAVQLKLPEASTYPEAQFLVALGTATQAEELFK